MQIQGSRVLVTGGCGLIGSTVVDLLLRQHGPAGIVILDNLDRGSLVNVEAALADPRVTLIRGDIRDRAAVAGAMRGVDAVIHLAALRITACAADPATAMAVMCDGSFNVVDAAQQAGVRKVVAASSASVYGQAEAFPTPESHHPYNNTTWYGASKVLLEGLLRAYHAMHGLPWVALRYFNVYGPRMDTQGVYTEVLIRWMDRIRDGLSPVVLGSGTQTMDFVYIDDVARATVLALASDANDEVFNVGSGTETSLSQLAAMLLQCMGSDLAVAYGPERRVNAVARRLADTRKAARLLGFEAEVDLREGLSRLVAWWMLQQQPTAVHS